MPNKSSKLSDNEIELVYNSLEDFIQENHKFPFIKDITDKTNLPKSKCEKILNYLNKKERTKIIFKAQSQPTIHIPTYMFEGILYLQHKPKWLQKYSFKEKISLIKMIEKNKEEINHFEIIERLLYGTDKPLEETVAYCLKLLGLEDVNLVNDSNKHDISFIYEGMKYIIEVKGLTKQGVKENISQLDSWIQQELSIESNDAELMGLFILNHYRRKDPEERGYPLTASAKKFLKYYKFKFFTTVFLYDIVKDIVQNKLNKTEGISKIIRGESYE